jgi:hypothetical protein
VKAAVDTFQPVLPALRKRLEACRNGYPQNGFIFAGPRKASRLNLANLARRVIVPALEASSVEWHGRHAFRRGLGTSQAGRAGQGHASNFAACNVSTTLAFCIKPVPENAQAAMRKLEKAIGRAEKYAERTRTRYLS